MRTLNDISELKLHPKCISFFDIFAFYFFSLSLFSLIFTRTRPRSVCIVLSFGWHTVFEYGISVYADI